MDNGTLNTQRDMQAFKRLSQQNKENRAFHGTRNATSHHSNAKKSLADKFKKLLFIFKSKIVSETSHSIAANLEKMSALLKEKDNRIANLLQYEYGAKKAIEQKNWQQEALEIERQQVKGLEKENESQKLALIESRQHALQLERAMQFLQNRIDDLISEKIEVSEEFQELQARADTLSKSNEDYSLQCQHLERQIAIETRENEDFEQEINALYKQFDVLKNSIESQKHALQSQQKVADEAREEVKDLQEANKDLKASFCSYKGEIAGIKLHLTQGLRDAKELENRYAEAVAERVETLRALQQLRHEYDKQHRELLEVKDRLGASLERERRDRSAFDEKTDILNKSLATNESKLKLSLIEQEKLLERLDLASIKNDMHESEISGLVAMNAQLSEESDVRNLELHHLEEQLHEASKELALLHNANDQLQQEIIAVTVQSEDKQLQLDEAQQHLAKKVRESALLNEKIEEFILREIEVGDAQEVLQQANTFLQNDLLSKDKKIKEGLEKAASLENEIIKWEEKWRQTNQSRQVLEEKIQDLEKIEMRHTQLQNLLLGFGGISSAGASDSIQPNTVSFETRSQITENDIGGEHAVRRHSRLQFGSPIEEDEKVEVSEEDIIENASSKPYPNLFDIPQLKSSPKQNLFD